jgi:hypothetical protein
MPRLFRRYSTKAIAEAFVAGVELVNDSALEVVQTYEDAASDAARPWVVELEDADQHEDQLLRDA